MASPTGIVNTHVEDSCCEKGLDKALSTGSLDSAAGWTCPKCGTEWHPHLEGSLRDWRPIVHFMIWR